MKTSENHSTVFIIHKGDNWYLRHTINSALKANWPTIMILGTEENTHYNMHPKVKHINLKELENNNTAQIEADYKHFSVNNIEYEKFCFLRWAYMEEAVRRLNVSRAILIDSDVLLFANPDEIAEKYSTADYLLTLQHNPSLVLLNNAQHVLHQLCNFITGIYQKSEAEIAAHIKNRQINRTYSSQNEKFYKKYPDRIHFSDMDKLQEFWEACNKKETISKYKISKIVTHALLDGPASPRNDMYFDSNFSTIINKTFTISNGRPHINIDTKIGSLHFQGSNKKYLAVFDGVCGIEGQTATVETIGGKIEITFNQ